MYITSRDIFFFKIFNAENKINSNYFTRLIILTSKKYFKLKLLDKKQISSLVL